MNQKFINSYNYSVENINASKARLKQRIVMDIKEYINIAQQYAIS